MGSFPAVREQLAVMKVEEQAALASTMALTGLLDHLNGGQASEPEVAVYRFLVNANKYLTSITATDVVHRGIEVLGGNGTIEDFSPASSPLSRCRRVRKLGGHPQRAVCPGVPRLHTPRPPRPGAGVGPGRVGHSRRQRGRHSHCRTEALEPRLRRSLADPEYAAAHFRRHLDHLTRVIQASCLLAEAVTGADDHKNAVAALFVRRHVAPEHRPHDEPGWNELVEAVSVTTWVTIARRSHRVVPRQTGPCGQLKL